MTAWQKALHDAFTTNQRLTERVVGGLRGDPQMPDGTPINGDTIGRLMAESAEYLTAEFGGDTPDAADA